MAVLKLSLCLLLFALALGAFASIVIFVIDVIRWHDREEVVKIVPSNSPEPEEAKIESEVIDNVTESDEHNTSTLFGSWG